jgi:hypothetical protein
VKIEGSAPTMSKTINDSCAGEPTNAHVIPEIKAGVRDGPNTAQGQAAKKGICDRHGNSLCAASVVRLNGSLAIWNANRQPPLPRHPTCLLNFTFIDCSTILAESPTLMFFIFLHFRTFKIENATVPAESIRLERADGRYSERYLYPSSSPSRQILDFAAVRKY